MWKNNDAERMKERISSRNKLQGKTNSRKNKDG